MGTSSAGLLSGMPSLKGGSSGGTSLFNWSQTEKQEGVKGTSSRLNVGDRKITISRDLLSKMRSGGGVAGGEVGVGKLGGEGKLVLPKITVSER